MTETEIRVTAKIVPSKERLGFLPKKLPTSFIAFEHTAYAVLSSQASEYNGGIWDFFDLSNDGFYMAPADYDSLELSVPSNGFIGAMSGDAAGVVASLFALNAICWRHPDSKELNDLYYQLREYACGHEDAQQILGAID